MKDDLKMNIYMTKKLLQVTTIVEQALIQAVLNTVRRRTADPSLRVAVLQLKLSVVILRKFRNHDCWSSLW
jgi:hypothetical protein